MEKEWILIAEEAGNVNEKILSALYPPERAAEEIIDIILKNRGISDKESFLNPLSADALLLQHSDALNIPKTGLNTSASLIEEAIKKGAPIFIHGDYDVDGICATAILWETIYRDLAYKNCFPFIPDRFNHGYGLSIDSIDAIGSKFKTGGSVSEKPLLITVDCGITSVRETAYARKKGFRTIIVDHHVKSGTLPEADGIVWTDKMCGAGIAWVLAWKLIRKSRLPDNIDKYLDLVALATVADIQPLTGANRSLVKYGLKKLNDTRRVGLKKLYEVAGIGNKEISTYDVGWVIAPRLNAAGRLDTALDALRILVINDEKRAVEIAWGLNRINSKRQYMTKSIFDKAVELAGSGRDRLIIVHHREFHEGVIGLAASKLVQRFYKPSIVISVNDKVSKGSARSIAGFDIVSALRGLEGIFENVGGHKMAAGFSIQTEKIEEFTDKFLRLGNELLDDKILSPAIKVDCEIPFRYVTFDLWNMLLRLEPFGVGNPKPVFLTKGVRIEDVRIMGSHNQHLKLKLTEERERFEDERTSLNALLFNVNSDTLLKEFKVGNTVDVVYSISLNEWGGKRDIELVLKDLKKVV